MRLLEYSNGAELSLARYIGDNVPQYAILSHTWGEETEEVTFGDLMDGTAKDKAGYRKIQFCAEQARRDGLQYFWVDTCCINKSSSTELTEAINSIFGWFEKGTICYAYLSDVCDENDHLSRSTRESAFRYSRWPLVAGRYKPALHQILHCIRDRNWKQDSIRNHHIRSHWHTYGSIELFEAAG